jgi:branched-chain amino acid transport system substrate-binding protein
MSRVRALALALFAALSLALSACGQAPAAAPAATTAPAAPEATAAPAAPEATAASAAPAASSRVVTIGYTASLSGKLNVESVRQQNGLKLWIDQVNAAGGVKLADGTTVTFEPKSYDDESNKDRVQELYTRLATEDNADFMVSPYSSGLADAAAVIAEQYGKIMITTGAADDATYKKGYTLVYQLYTPASRYLTGAVDLLAQQDSTIKKLAIVHENDKFSTSVGDAVKAYAEGKGYEVVLYEGYDSGTSDFAPFINKITQAKPEAILGGGHFQDGSTFAKQLFEKQVPVKYLALLVAPPEPSFAELGEAAIGTVGPSQWEPQATFNQEAATKLGISWIGPDSAGFVEAYTKAYGEEPSYHAAGGYAAGLAIQRAIEQAGSVDTKAIKAVLDEMNLLTFFGNIKFDTTAEAHGLQAGHEMVYIQWQGAVGSLGKQVVWPADAATAKLLYPIR